MSLKTLCDFFVSSFNFVRNTIQNTLYRFRMWYLSVPLIFLSSVVHLPLTDMFERLYTFYPNELTCSSWTTSKSKEVEWRSSPQYRIKKENKNGFILVMFF